MNRYLNLPQLKVQPKKHTSPEGVMESQTTGLAMQCKNWATPATKYFGMRLHVGHPTRSWLNKSSKSCLSVLRTSPCANVNQEREDEVSCIRMQFGVGLWSESEREREIRSNLCSPCKHNSMKFVGSYRLLWKGQLASCDKEINHDAPITPNFPPCSSREIARVYVKI